jgi:hypothetical protein
MLIGWSGSPTDPKHPITAVSMQLQDGSQGAVFAKLLASHATIQSAKIIDGLAKQTWTLILVTVTSVQPASAKAGGAAKPIVLLNVGKAVVSSTT